MVVIQSLEPMTCSSIGFFDGRVRWGEASLTDQSAVGSRRVGRDDCSGGLGNGPFEDVQLGFVPRRTAIVADRTLVPYVGAEHSDREGARPGCVPHRDWGGSFGEATKRSKMISHFPGFGVPMAHMFLEVELLVEDDSKVPCVGTWGASEGDV